MYENGPKTTGRFGLFGGGGWDGTPPQKMGGGGTTPNVGVEKCRIWGAVPLRGAPILGCRTQRFGAKKADFGAAGSHLGDEFFWGGVPNLGGGALSNFGWKSPIFGEKVPVLGVRPL